jgi:hypothetical protein
MASGPTVAPASWEHCLLVAYFSRRNHALAPLFYHICPMIDIRCLVDLVITGCAQ